MIDDCGVRPEGCISEPCSDISPNWMDIRSKFGYTLLCGNSSSFMAHELSTYVNYGGFKW